MVVIMARIRVGIMVEIRIIVTIRMRDRAGLG